ncbi:MAG: MmcQ/YjbR family DNA-binding protein [Vicinamibacterales bacterium]
MTVNEFRRLVLALTGAEEGAHMGHPDFRVGGRVFASLHGTPLHGMAKVSPHDQARLIETCPDVFEPEAGAWGRAGCTRVRLEQATTEEVGEALTLAWQRAIAQGPTRPKARRTAPRGKAAAVRTRR